MPANLASQSAARKLAQILGVLLLPILALTVLYFQQSRSGIDHIEDELRGVELAELAVPLLLSPTGGHDAAMLARAADLEASINIAPDMRIERLLQRQPGEVDTADVRFADYMRTLGKTSGVVYEGDAETSFLASTAFVHVPLVIRRFAALQDIVTRGTQGSASAHVAEATMAVGAISEAYDRLHDALETAVANSSSPASYDSLVILIGELGNSVDRLRTIANTPAPDLAALGASSHNGTMRLAMLQSTRAISSATFLKLRSQLRTRSDTLWQKLVGLTSAGLSSAMIGVLLAFTMFRSTLVRLDEVEGARVEADKARHEAETMAGQLTIINGDISRLNQELASNVQKLKAAQDGLIKKGRMEQIGQLTATIAHEIRNPLGAVRTSAFLLERRLAGKGLNVEGQIQRINNGVERCDKIISQLLDLSRTRQISATLENLDDWLAKTVREHAARMPAMVFIECALGLDGAQVPFDTARMERAVVNLLNNACEAMVGTGDEPSKFATQHPRIWVSSRRDGEFAVIRVADNGPGISAENLARIREPLFTTKSFGTGLGIPAIEQIALQHGGRLEVDSTVGKGATFSILLPLHAAAHAAA